MAVDGSIAATGFIALLIAVELSDMYFLAKT